ncbi:MAG: GDP-mannose 4,6-dehydratase, partial [Clostridia bacterium]
MKKTILVTGGAGYIASHTNVVLLENGFDVVAVDNFVNSNIGSVKAVEKITGKKVKFVEGDVCDKALLNKVFDENDIYAVIHFAGLKAVGESCVLPLKYYQNNLISTLSLVEVMAKHNVKRLIFSSSATVYGTPEALPLNEKSKIGGTTNPYGT